ncbi:MAG: YihY/virulence factor BrkB family protein [Candidatus Aminicenantes bacterium]|nr:YihY/virulence factor BrkB family protein [Candidatus Aminicenantes bacterium]
MRLKELNILKNLWIALKQFFNEDGLDKSSVLAFYSIISTLFLLTFFTFLFTKLLGDPDIAIKSMYPFSPDFFSKISPEIFDKAEEISTKLREIGIIGILFSFFLSFFIIKKIVQFVNEMFEIRLKDRKAEKGFVVRRISEFGLLFFIGLLAIATFLFTGFVSAVESLLSKSEFMDSIINTQFIESVNSFLLVYAAPFGVTFLFFFILYKWIPEKKVYAKGALIAALICTALWEVLKRAYGYYLVHLSIIGPGKLRGPIIAIILFGLWMEISMAIMLYGAKLTYVFDKENDDKTTTIMWDH